MQAVITADIVNSTCLTDEKLSRLMDDIREIIAWPDKIEFFRGDSYQAFIRQGTSALRKAVMCRLKAISYGEGARIDIRQSISLGKVSKPVDSVGRHIEPVFVKSGRLFDKMATERRTTITSELDPPFDLILDILSRYIDELISKVTVNQAIILNLLALNKSQTEVACILEKTPATVNKQIRASKYRDIEELISDFEKLTQKISEHGQ
ncbi:hypothetical protein [Chitinophaga sp. sic0106]|uniref:hypothetical protein n=1 Tax=Chitinophaga sp. sic0106 TaxID=2854785 RepID=UPI001C4602A5|nr:hypothetical protein [Chitinophaga sp. sic0106]MBV7532841.1 hypothetical protein [Chitinophaga sp. sic0106]